MPSPLLSSLDEDASSAVAGRTRPGPPPRTAVGSGREAGGAISVADLEGHDGDVRGDSVRVEVDGVDAAVMVRVGDDRRGVVVDPVLVLVGRDRDPQHRVDVLAEARGADDPGVPDLVRRLVGEAGQVEEVGEVLRVPGTDRGGREEHDQTRNLLVHAGCEGAGEGRLILVRRRPGQLEVGPTRREARVTQSEIDEETLALFSGDVTVPGCEDLDSHRGIGLLRRTLPGGSRGGGRREDGRERDEEEGGEQRSLAHWNLLVHGWHCSVPRTPRGGAYSRTRRRDRWCVASKAAKRVHRLQRRRAPPGRRPQCPFCVRFLYGTRRRKTVD